MTNEINTVNELGMTDEQFVEQYVEKAKESIEAADAWVRELTDGFPDPEFITRLAPAVLAALSEAGLINVAEAVIAETQDSTPEVADASPEAVQDATAASTED